MILSLITNDLAHVGIAGALGIERILVDLEIETKQPRQSGRQLFLSDHSLEDVGRIRAAYPQISLTVRINSIHQGSRAEIAQLAALQPDRVMLPFIQSLAEIDLFLELLPVSIQPVLLLENIFSLQIIPKLLADYPIREVFVGLNDLSIDLGHSNLILTILHDSFKRAMQVLRDSSLTWGLGGIGSFADCHLPIAPQQFFEFQLCLGGHSGWLSRSFRRLFEQPHPRAVVAAALQQLRSAEKTHAGRSRQAQQQFITEFERCIAPLSSVAMY